MPFEIHAHLQDGYRPSLTTVILELLVFVYSRGWFGLRRAFPISFPAWRAAAFVAGLFSLWIALSSPLAVLDHQLLTVHMMKHLLLMTVGAPLILLGAPALPLLCGLPKWFMRRGLLFRRRLPLLGHFLSNPVFCWLAGTAAVIAWHIPTLFQLGISSDTWRARAFCPLVFCSGGPSSGLGRVRPADLDGPCPCTSSSVRCPATFFPHFSPSVAALFIQAMYLRPAF